MSFAVVVLGLPADQALLALVLAALLAWLARLELRAWRCARTCVRVRVRMCARVIGHL